MSSSLTAGPPILILQTLCPAPSPHGAFLSAGSFAARLWPDHDRHPGGTDLLLRGGLPPAVPEQEPRRVLRPRGHWSVLSTGS